MASKALLMSSVTRTVLSGGFGEFMPSITFVRRVLVECIGLKPCCEDASGM